MERDYVYSAFISYSSKDEKTAKSLWKKLERYRLPAVLQKQHEEIPAKMHVFLDQGDIVPGGSVENALCRELADSKKLIVICSPNSANSKYVELEVNNFLALGHTMKDVIPYIIDGEVDKNSPNNCYVPSLFGKDDKDTANGVSVIRDGKWKAFVGVLANILDVKFDEIYKREKVRRNRIIALRSTAAAVALAFLCVLTWYVTPHTKYYADYVTRWGVPEGILPLTKEEIKHRPTHYKITYKAFRPIELRYENAIGVLEPETADNEHQNRPSQANYFYESNYAPSLNKQKWAIAKAEYTFGTPSGQYNQIKDFSVLLEYEKRNEMANAQFVNFYYSTEGNVPKLPRSLSNNMLSAKNIFCSGIMSLTEVASHLVDSNESPIFGYKVMYNENGFESRRYFLNKGGETAYDKNDIIGIAYEHDDIGRITEEQYLFQAYSVLCPVKYKQFSYDARGNVKSIDFYKKSDFFPGKKQFVINPVRNFASAQIVWTVDEYGNYVETRNYFDDNLNPIYALVSEQIIDASSFASEIENVYDKNGFLVRQKKQLPFGGLQENSSNYELKEKNIVLQSNYYTCMINPETEEKYEQTSESDTMYDEDGNFKELVATTHYINTNETIVVKARREVSIDDSTGNTIEWLFSEGAPQGSDFSQGLDEDIYDIYGRLVKSTSIYGGEKQSVEIQYYGGDKSIRFYKNNIAFEPEETGIASADYTYDSKGKLTEIIFKDKNGNRKNNKLTNFCTLSQKYTASGICKLAEFKDEYGKLIVPFGEHFAKFEAEDKDNKYLRKGAYMLPNGDYARDNYIAYFDYENISDTEIIVTDYNGYNKPVKQEIYIDDELYQNITYTYTSDGYTKYILNSDDVCIYTEKYNAHNKLYEIRKQITTAEGDFIETVDANGSLLSRMLFDADGNIEKVFQDGGEATRLSSRDFIMLNANANVKITFKDDGADLFTALQLASLTIGRNMGGDASVIIMLKDIPIKNITIPFVVSFDAEKNGNLYNTTIEVVYTLDGHTDFTTLYRENRKIAYITSFYDINDELKDNEDGYAQILEAVMEDGENEIFYRRQNETSFRNEYGEEL